MHIRIMPYTYKSYKCIKSSSQLPNFAWPQEKFRVYLLEQEQELQVFILSYGWAVMKHKTNGWDWDTGTTTVYWGFLK